ncbi:hypothetical protein D3C71_2012630 [compost metagenome]
MILQLLIIQRILAFAGVGNLNPSEISRLIEAGGRNQQRFREGKVGIKIMVQHHIIFPVGQLRCPLQLQLIVVAYISS